MYSVKVRDQIMIAHSLQAEAFGPARNIHGATYIVDASFYSSELNEYNIVLDIGLAQNTLKSVCAQLNYQFLDELPEFKGKLTTTEFLAKHIHDQLKSEIRPHFAGRISIELGESATAWASYHGDDE